VTHLNSSPSIVFRLFKVLPYSYGGRIRISAIQSFRIVAQSVQR